MHHCDTSTQSFGGLLTLSRALRALIDAINMRTPTVIAEMDECQKCRILLTLNLTGMLARTALEQNPDARMGLEMSLATVQAALDRGEVETPPDGFH